ncbi:Uncharacterized membrane protein YoaK, UPF0700 family [Granulicella rosea]|uniref:Uncharacterized membrane protein YoaK, UPF0700 family n=1 Tax=Granulicella rosea TaxID=474952 RepID=A0A239LPL7_9BACT|nr:YoaK family protein [Granulicella rosea]SNT32627.1 Uncharacterized membrane protein YoaK, UPF0700 family [Granulicella rosea]
MPNTPDPPEQRVESLPTALLLAATGGLLDAAVYLLHGHVFANAMTGNVVLMGVAAFSRQPGQAVRHLAPILTFLFAVTCSKTLRRLPARRAVLGTLLLELAVLAVAGALPMSFPQMLFTALITFGSTFQVASFRRVGHFSYNSTFVTGNLRDAAEGFYDALLADEPAQRRDGREKALALGAVCLCFLAGAAIGTIAAPRLGNHAFWIALPLLGAVALHVGRGNSDKIKA